MCLLFNPAGRCRYLCLLHVIVSVRIMSCHHTIDTMMTIYHHPINDQLKRCLLLSWACLESCAYRLRSLNWRSISFCFAPRAYSPLHHLHQSLSKSNANYRPCVLMLLFGSRSSILPILFHCTCNVIVADPSTGALWCGSYTALMY